MTILTFFTWQSYTRTRVIVKQQNYSGRRLLRFGKGWFSSSRCLHSPSKPRQFPFDGPLAKEATTLNACMFFWNSCMFGWSCVPPRCRWHPKQFSSGSWQIRWLRNTFTSGSVNMYFTRSTKELTAKAGHVILKKYFKIFWGNNVPVICKPSRVSGLSNIFRFSTFVKWGLSSTEVFQSRKYTRNSSFNH